MLTESEGVFVRPVYKGEVQGNVKAKPFCVQEGLKQFIIFASGGIPFLY